MPDKFYVGLDVTQVDDNGKRPAVSSVTLQVDGDNVVSAGAYSGTDLYAICPYATQEMATAILAMAQGYQYQAFSADSANLDPAAELGDGVSVDGIYGVISAIRDSGDGYPGISAPGEVELEDEYPYRSSAQREFASDVDSLRAFITKSLGEMSLQITTLTGRVETLAETVDAMSRKVTELDSRVTALGG